MNNIFKVNYFFPVKVVYWWTKCYLFLVLSADCGISYKQNRVRYTITCTAKLRYQFLSHIPDKCLWIITAVLINKSIRKVQSETVSAWMKTCGLQKLFYETCRRNFIYIYIYIYIVITGFHYTHTHTHTGLFDMVVGVLTTCHTQYTWDRSIYILFI